MKNCLIIFVVFLFTLVIQAEEQAAENGNLNLNETVTEEEQPQTDSRDAEKFFTRLKFGIGADFSGMAGMLQCYDYTLRNQFGASIGMDFNWRVFKKESGRGEGNFYIGFGFNFQYWMPTTWRNKDTVSEGYYSDDDIPDFYIKIHYMRVPITLNLAYELKAGIGSLKSVEPRVSLGINNNIFKFGWGSSDEERSKELSEDMKELNHRIYNYKISGTWSLGLSFVFENNWFFSTSIGGDFGSSNYKSNVFYERPYEYDDEDKKTEKLKSNKYGRFLYSHHEFMMFETGYRF